MKVGCLQFAPKLGEVHENIRKADSLLEDTSSSELDLLVLPEMAFSGKRCLDLSPRLGLVFIITNRLQLS
jgi:predicted amidohydrolase